MDAQRFDSLVRSIYEGVLAPAGWQTLLADLRLELGCEQAAYMVHHRPSQRTVVAEIAQFDLEFVRQYEHRYVALDPVRPAVDAMPEGDWFIDERELGASTKRRSEFYQDFLRPYGLGAIICTPLINDGPTLAGLAFQSHLRDQEQGADKARRLVPLISHLRCAARLRMRFGELARQAELGRRMLDHFTMPLMVVNVRAQVLIGNAAAEQWLIEEGRLFSRACAAGSGIARADLERLARQICGSGDGPAMPAALKLCEAAGPAILMGLPLAPAHPMSGRFQEPVGMLAVLRPHHARRAGLGLLRELYGLSKAEVRLVLAWSGGGSLVDAASALNLSRDTVRTQIKSVFRKTGCASQTALTRLVASLGMLA
jgi:DNA-binding CsgD family transcriptional regulator